MCPLNDDDTLEDEFEARVQRQTQRIEQGRREKGMNFWQYLGLIGAVGWGVVVPMLVGVLVGRAIDGKAGTEYAWTLGMLVLGLALGCFNAWRMVTKDH